MMNTILRSYQKQDFLPLKHIIRETWHYDQMCSPKTADKLARVFLTSCLTNYTFSQVAVCQGEVVGIILDSILPSLPSTISTAIASSWTK